MAEPEFSGFELTSEEVVRMKPILSKVYSPPWRTTTVSGLLSDWAKLVGQVAATYPFTIDDYTNHLGCRDGLEIVLRESPPSVQARLREVVGKLDDEFYNSTTEVDHPLLGDRRRFPKNGHPWWYRLPKKRRKSQYWGSYDAGSGKE